MPGPWNNNCRTQYINCLAESYNITTKQLGISKILNPVILVIGGKCINIHDIINSSVSYTQILIEVVEFELFLRSMLMYGACNHFI